MHLKLLTLVADFEWVPDVALDTGADGIVVDDVADRVDPADSGAWVCASVLDAGLVDGAVVVDLALEGAAGVGVAVVAALARARAAVARRHGVGEGPARVRHARVRRRRRSRRRRRTLVACEDSVKITIEY